MKQNKKVRLAVINEWPNETRQKLVKVEIQARDALLLCFPIFLKGTSAVRIRICSMFHSGTVRKAWHSNSSKLLIWKCLFGTVCSDCVRTPVALAIRTSYKRLRLQETEPGYGVLRTAFGNDSIMALCQDN